MQTKNIVIDTDIGDDVDDLLALALAVREPELKLLGITTVFRNTHLRAEMARYYLKTFTSLGDVPVHAGIGAPLVESADVSLVPNQYRPEMAEYPPDSTDAAAFLRELLAGQRITLICIGPLTNIATLVRDHPEVTGHIEELVIMAGCYRHPWNEWNIACDPEAAEIVFASGLPIRAVGLDVTTRCTISAEQLSAISENSEHNRFLLRACSDWQNESGFLPMLHDPLTVYSLLERSDLTFRSEHVSIETSGKLTRGMTVCSPSRIWGREPGHYNAEVALDLDSNRFVSDFLSTVFATA